MQENKMGSKKITPLLISMSLPAMLSMLMTALYNIVDSIYVAQIGQDALTSVSLAFPIQMFIIAISIGTSIGVNSLISRRLGEKRIEEANKAASHGLILSVINWVAFAIFGLFFSEMFISLFSDSEPIIKMGTQYISITTILSFGVFIQIIAEKTLQATGNMIWPMVFQMVGAITNIILDPILIFGYFGFPAMGITGAAIATVTGQMLGMILSLYVLFFKKHDIHITFKQFHFDKEIIRNIYIVGLPAMVMQSIGSFMLMGMNAILAGFSEIAISVLGIYFKLQSFIFMPVFGLTQGLMPILGYNYGAKNKERMLSALKVGLIMAGSIMLFGTILFNVFPLELLMLFNPEPELLNLGILALKTISISFVFGAGGIIFSTLFQAMGKGVYSLFISALRQLVIILPCAYILVNINLNLVWYSFPIAEIISLFVSIFFFVRIYKKQIKILGNEEKVINS